LAKLTWAVTVSLFCWAGLPRAVPANSREAKVVVFMVAALDLMIGKLSCSIELKKRLEGFIYLSGATGQPGGVG
jgi:hypothetical protein